MKRRREMGQLSLADGLVHRQAGANDRLDKIAGLLDWRTIERIVEAMRPARRGALPYPELVVMKALLLQQWYALSDPALEEALSDRLSFRRFIGVPLDRPVPDHSTLWRFRELLTETETGAKVMAEVNRQLEAKNLILKRGTLIDASVVAAQAKAPSPPDKDQPPRAEPQRAPEASSGTGEKPGKPQDRPASRLVNSEVDPDARWTRRGQRYFFGYKAHIATDQDSRIIREAILTGANVNDTEQGDALIQGDEGAVYADKAYDSKARGAWLKAKGIKNQIMRRGNKHHEQSRAIKNRNKRIGKVRGAVEAAFATMKRLYGYRRVRYFNLARNQTQLTLMCVAINLRRALVLTR